MTLNREIGMVTQVVNGEGEGEGEEFGEAEEIGEGEFFGGVGVEGAGEEPGFSGRGGCFQGTAVHAIGTGFLPIRKDIPVP